MGIAIRSHIFALSPFQSRASETVKICASLDRKSICELCRVRMTRRFMWTLLPLSLPPMKKAFRVPLARVECPKRLHEIFIDVRKEENKYTMLYKYGIRRREREHLSLKKRKFSLINFLFEFTSFVINVKNNLMMIPSRKSENVQRNRAADLDPVVIYFLSLRPPEQLCV